VLSGFGLNIFIGVLPEKSKESKRDLLSILCKGKQGDVFRKNNCFEPAFLVAMSLF